MALTYACGPEEIDLALERMKEDGLVSRDARFNHGAAGGLRSEVAYRDFDFLSRLGRVGTTETIASILSWLEGIGLVPVGSAYDEGAFGELHQLVTSRFNIPGTSITPVMERLLHMLSSVKKPRRVIGLGTYCGYALVWAIGASCGPGRQYVAEHVYGIDIDAGATEQARVNLSRLPHVDHVELLTEDGLRAVERLPGPFDYVFLDVESKEMGKGLYLELLERLYDKIEPDGWVLAHDTVVPPFAGQLAAYLAFVRDRQYFRESVSFDLDAYGLELSVR